MDTIRETLSREHQRCDELFAEAESAINDGEWTKALELYQTFQPAMVRHMAVEEEILFPALEENAGGPMAPTQVMRGEHEEMRRLLDQMAYAIEARSADDYLGLAETLLILMQQHNLKEEEVLYNLADQMLADKRTELLSRMEAFGK